MRSDPPTTEQPAGEPASHSTEVERKFDVDDETPLPSWESVSGVASVGDPEVRELDARYLDTAARDLSRAGYALRRRSGGPDEGWHVKGPLVRGGRVELHWPLDDADSDAVEVPAEIRVHLLTLKDADGALVVDEGDAFEPLARIRNTRTAYALRAGDGGLVAEFVDDRVSATDERSGVERSWREWEFELGPAAPEDHEALFTAVDAAVRAVGGREAASASKLARALGD